MVLYLASCVKDGSAINMWSNFVTWQTPSHIKHCASFVKKAIILERERLLRRVATREHGTINLTVFYILPHLISLLALVFSDWAHHLWQCHLIFFDIFHTSSNRFSIKPMALKFISPRKETSYHFRATWMNEGMRGKGKLEKEVRRSDLWYT